MRISQFAARTGVPATTLRYYESAGLVPAGRTGGGYRLYADRDVDRVAFIQAAKRVGLSLGEIRELLTEWEHNPCAEVRAQLRPLMVARLSEVTTRATDLTAFSALLRDAIAQLDALPARTELCDAECGFLSPATRTPIVDLALTPAVNSASISSEAPVACSLGPGDHRTRVQQWRDLLSGSVREPEGDGIRIRLPIERAAALAHLAAAEQQCCPFYRFSLHLRSPEIVLEVHAPPSAAQMLRELFGPLAATTS